MKYKAFNHNWFKKHQKLILWFLNAPILRLWFRYKLGITKIKPLYENGVKVSEGFKGKVEKLTPEGINFNKRIENGRIRVDFRVYGDWNFSKKIYHTFKWIWWTMHFLDWLILERQSLVPNFGFASFGPLYSGVSGFAPVDGYMDRGGVAESFATIRSGAGTSANNAGSSGPLAGIFGNGAGSTYDQLSRGIAGYNTGGSIGSGFQIDTATWSGTPREKADTLPTAGSWAITDSTPQSNSTLVASDFNIARWAMNHLNDTDKTISSMSVDTEFTITLNATGIAYLSVTGYSFLGFVINGDRTNTAPGVPGLSYAGMYSADSATRKHHLDGTYSAASGGATHNLSLIGVGT